MISHNGKINSFPTPRIGNRINHWINILPMYTYLVYPCIPFPSKKMSNLFLTNLLYLPSQSPWVMNSTL
ncbi:hypothetical protein FKM82_026736 [Ascaphus truei]